ncbi:MAG: nuclear transport factor 2 family protein [Halodesulfurarchaeum sp.]|nr:nuclear transport factor 2 family protein [Halodesulfurarchaeum sp.]
MNAPAGSSARDGPTLAREYYRAIDAGDWAALRAVLDPDFTQERGDRTFEDREAFVTFMAENRPETDTEHVIEQVYTGPGGVAVRGRLLRGDGSLFFEFVDVFRVERRLTHLRTYSAV